MKKQIILCSGGLDSVTAAWYIHSQNGSELTILFFNYSQRNLEGERRAAKKCAEDLNASFHEISLPILSKSNLTNKNKPNSLTRSDLKDTSEESQNWYVPFRNGIFLAHAISFAESLSNLQEEYEIITGFKNEGSEPFPDATGCFVDAMNRASRLGTNAKPKIIAPLINKDKEDIIALGNSLGLNFRNTFSCYVGPSEHCGTCLACRLRQEGFRWANLEDPTLYLNS